MANFLLVIDPSSVRRAEFMKKVSGQIELVPGLKIQEISLKDFSAIWARGKIPVSTEVSPTSISFILGNAIAGEGPERLSAKGLAALWKGVPASIPPPLNGLHIAAYYEHGAQCVLGADLLGLMPVYYFNRDDVCLIASSAELFKHHPLFRAALDPSGLVSILLMNGLVGSRTLFQGVRRLPAGNLIYRKSMGEVLEVQQYRIPVSKKYFHLSTSDQLDLIDTTIKRVFRRHFLPDKTYDLFFSGGMDSRMMAAYLQEMGVSIRALTFGKSSDIEMKCARAAAQALGLRQKMIEVEMDNYPSYALLEAKWRHLSSGFNCLFDWGRLSHLNTSADFLTSGYLMDTVIGGVSLFEDYSPEGYFRFTNSWGIDRDILKNLCREEVFGDAVDEAVFKIKEKYAGYSDTPFQRAFCASLYQRGRSHTGSALWIHSLAAWPVAPSIDTELIDLMAGMPEECIRSRRGQRELFCRRFPRLAALAIDRNSYYFAPLRPRFKKIEKLFYKGLETLHNVRHKLQGEHRFYYRVMDFNSKGWKQIRHQAEPHREKVCSLFNKEALDKFLPPPDKNVVFKDGIINSSGLKMMVGFMLWSKDHL